MGPARFEIKVVPVHDILGADPVTLAMALVICVGSTIIGGYSR
jgi:hypothetical protein